MQDEPRGLDLEPDRSSRHSLGIHASPAEVYRALTDPAVLSRWLVSEASIDLRPGGAYRWVFGEATGAPGAEVEVAAGEVVAAVPHDQLLLRVLVEDIETHLEFRLEPWREATVVTVTHGSFPGDEAWDETFHSIDRGWESELHALKIYLEKAKGMVRRSCYFEARFEANPEQVFDAFTTTAGLEGWLAERAAVDASPGGELRLEWDGRPPVRGHIGVCDPDRFLLMTWEVEHPSIVRVRLEGSAGDAQETAFTEVAIEHRLFAPDAGSFNPFDWDAALALLARSLRSARAT
jgi:uncharacterized protein YndB with AHSA1/START domain